MPASRSAASIAASFVETVSRGLMRSCPLPNRQSMALLPALEAITECTSTSRGARGVRTRRRGHDRAPRRMVWI